MLIAQSNIFSTIHYTLLHAFECIQIQIWDYFSHSQLMSINDKKVFFV